MLAFSVTCSNCNRSFIDIDESLIGQQARCKCGTVVELDPIWDFKRSKTKNRGAESKVSTAPEQAARSVETSKRDIAVDASDRPPTKHNAASNKPRSSGQSPKSKKRKSSKKSQPAEALSAAEMSPTPTSDQNSLPTSKSTSFDNFADLEQILAGGVDHTPLESTRVDSPFEETAADTKPNQRGQVSAIVGGMAGILTTVGLLATRFSSFDGTPLGWSGHALYGTYTASIGTGEMTPVIANAFIGIGCWLLLLAVLTGVSSVLLLCRAAIRISTDRKTLGWSRGLVATLSVVGLFSLLGLLFVEAIHHGNLLHDLDSFSISAPVEGLLEPVNDNVTFQDIRQKYKAESTEFLIGVLAFAALPLVSFGGAVSSLLFDEN